MPPGHVDPADERLSWTWHALRAIRIGQDSGALTYRPDLSAPGRAYMVEIPGRPGALSLVDDEPLWWLLGYLDAGDDPRATRSLLKVLRETPPATVDAWEAAAMLPGVDRFGRRRTDTITHIGVRHILDQGTLVWHYGPDQRRRLYTAQVAAEAARRDLIVASTDQTRLQDAAATAQAAGRPYRALAAKAMASVRRTQTTALAAASAAAQWARIEALLPEFPTVRGTPAPARVTRLTVSPDHSWHRRRHDALTLGHGSGWFDYLHPYVVDLGGEVRRELPERGVLPWVRGVADRHGQGSLVVYRAGMERLRGRRPALTRNRPPG